jgi:tungstate transport system substrate-binding protein
MVVNPVKHPGVNDKAAQVFANWVTSQAGQEVIAGYKIDGQVLFHPNANANINANVHINANTGINTSIKTK